MEVQLPVKNVQSVEPGYRRASSVWHATAAHLLEITSQMMKRGD